MKLMNKKTPLPVRKIRVGKLDSLKEVAKTQGRLIKKVLKAGGDCNFEYKVTCMLSMLAKTLEGSDLEGRIEALERQTRKGI